MNYQYKVIVCNRTVYKEFEIPADMENVRLGTTSLCEFRLNPEFFFEDIEIEFTEESNQWNIDCSDSIYFRKGDMRKLYSTGIGHGDIISVCYSNTGNEAFELRFLIDFEARVPNYNWYIEIADKVEISSDRGATLCLKSQFDKNIRLFVMRKGTARHCADLQCGRLCARLSLVAAGPLLLARAHSVFVLCFLHRRAFAAQRRLRPARQRPRLQHDGSGIFADLEAAPACDHTLGAADRRRVPLLFEALAPHAATASDWLGGQSARLRRCDLGLRNGLISPQRAKTAPRFCAAPSFCSTACRDTGHAWHSARSCSHRRTSPVFSAGSNGGI